MSAGAFESRELRYLEIDMKLRAPVFSLDAYREQRARTTRTEADPDWHPAKSSYAVPETDAPGLVFSDTGEPTATRAGQSSDDGGRT